jgi:hypothetical protein
MPAQVWIKITRFVAEFCQFRNMPVVLRLLVCFLRILQVDHERRMPDDPSIRSAPVVRRPVQLCGAWLLSFHPRGGSMALLLDCFPAYQHFTDPPLVLKAISA